MKNLIKTIITSILTAAILITGISVDTTTVTAATTNNTFQNGGTVTLKPGDSMKLLVQDSDGEDDTYGYKWSSSDTNVLKVETDFYDDTKDYTECVVLIGVSTGTATVIGKGKGLRPNITMTVTVALPKATAKQKKCKHKYKTTKAATCERAGIKTCKKCKFQKMIAKPDHKYVTKKVTKVEYDYFTATLECHGMDIYCPDNFTATIKYDKDGNVAPDSDYPDRETWWDAIGIHMAEAGHGGFGGIAAYTPYGPGHTVKKTVEMCKWCGKEKNPEKTISQKINEKEAEKLAAAEAAAKEN